MKINRLVSFLFLLQVSLVLNAQENEYHSWSMKLGYSRINNYEFSRGNIGELTVEGNYRINKLFETGLYTGFSLSKSKMYVGLNAFQ